MIVARGLIAWVGLRQGDAAMNVQRLGNPAALAALGQANTLWDGMKKDLDAILGTSQNLFRAQSSATAITSISSSAASSAISR